uniref:Uncharacterized protein n=1 Tax=Eumeta variegata TaxID=151549 RepID=A0A4C1XUN6_EUMVA|nr:hypothetical protein EVAR_59527_1 [Eumeta japonica]
MHFHAKTATSDRRAGSPPRASQNAPDGRKDHDRPRYNSDNDKMRVPVAHSPSITPQPPSISPSSQQQPIVLPSDIPLRIYIPIQEGISKCTSQKTYLRSPPLFTPQQRRRRGRPVFNKRPTATPARSDANSTRFRSRSEPTGLLPRLMATDVELNLS